MRMLRWAMAACLLVPCIAADTAYARPRHAKCAQAPVRAGYARCHTERRAGLVSMAQISPAIRRSRAPNLDEPVCGPCLRPPDGWYWRGKGRGGRAPAPDLIEALQRPPDAATAPVLREAGIPVVPDVPPIVIVQPRSGRERHRAIRSQQPQ